MIALGRLGWSLRRIEAGDGSPSRDGWRLFAVSRSGTACAGWLGTQFTGTGHFGDHRLGRFKTGHRSDHRLCRFQAADNSKPAIEVTTGFLQPATPPETDGKRTASASEAYREMIELELSRGRNAMGIWQDLVDRHGFAGGYQSVQAFRAQAARSRIAGSASDHRDAAR